MGVQQLEEIFSLARTTFRSSQNMVVVGANDIRRRKMIEEKIGWVLYLFCSVKLSVIPMLFVFGNLVTYLKLSEVSILFPRKIKQGKFF